MGQHHTDAKWDANYNTPCIFFLRSYNVKISTNSPERYMEKWFTLSVESLSSFST